MVINGYIDVKRMRTYKRRRGEQYRRRGMLVRAKNELLKSSILGRAVRAVTGGDSAPSLDCGEFVRFWGIRIALEGTPDVSFLLLSPFTSRRGRWQLWVCDYAPSRTELAPSRWVENNGGE